MFRSTANCSEKVGKEITKATEAVKVGMLTKKMQQLQRAIIKAIRGTGTMSLGKPMCMKWWGTK
jgi:hypothetical protein